MRILVCDDESFYRDAVCQAIGKWKLVSGHADVQVSAFASTEELLERFDQQIEADLLFLDIEIPGEINGLDLAQRIRRLNNSLTIVFVTNYDAFVFDGYAVNAFRYLLKPIEDEDIFFCCSYVYNRLFNHPGDCIALTFKNTQMVLRFNEIRYIEAQSHTLFLYSSNLLEPVKVQMRLSDMSERLPDRLFAYCHRSYIVNVSYIRLLTRSRILLFDGTDIPVSRTYIGHLNDTFDAYFRGGRIQHGLDCI